MLINNQKIPYVLVDSEFSLNPFPVNYNVNRDGLKNSKLKNKWLTGDEVSVPVTYTRRGNEEKSWNDVRKEITDMTYKLGREPYKISFSFSEGLYYLGHVVSVNFDEEHAYVAKGSITFYTDYPYLIGDGNTITVTPAGNYFEIAGQLPSNWSSRTTFTSPQSEFILESADGKIKLTYEFIKGDVLEIDSLNRNIKLNSEIDLDVGLSLNSAWFDLKPNYLTLSASHETEITYTEKYY